MLYRGTAKRVRHISSPKTWYSARRVGSHSEVNQYSVGSSSDVQQIHLGQYCLGSIESDKTKMTRISDGRWGMEILET